MTLDSAIPRATYRLQLNRGFTFEHARAIVPYLSELGISHCYISPCLKARPGSMHGYDIVDHGSLNPEIGSPEDFERFVNTLREHAMGLIVDVVPNHMGVMGSDNAWWLDVLENGEASAYAGFFDIDWHPLKEELRGKVLVPVLHDHYGAVLESGEIQLVFRAERGGFDISYRDHRFPVNPRQYPRILQHASSAIAAKLGEQDPDVLEFQSLITAFRHLPARQDADRERVAERNRDKEIHKRRLAELSRRSPEVVAGINVAVSFINGSPADAGSFDELHELIKVQAFRLANWRVAADDINYRRFFDTNDLAALSAENESVFQATHRLILQFVAEGKVDGLRVDHPDGLYDPAQYFHHLQRQLCLARENASVAGQKKSYVVIEKILTGEERLPAGWPVSGTTGYDFSNLVNGLFIDPEAASRFERIYRIFIGEKIDFDDLAYRSRRLIINVALASELSVLAHQLTRIALSKRHTCDFTLNSLRLALTEVVANFPVYRTYVSPSGASENDVRHIHSAVDAAKLKSPAGDTSIFDFIAGVLLTSLAEGQDARYRKAVLAFAMKFQQFTSPVMAKGLEDTAFYRYNRLISLNDVGGDLHRFGVTESEFHAANQERLRDWPNTMLATSTHDSKRSEDVRARINVLSEMPGLWRLRVRDWRRINHGFKGRVNNQLAPSFNDEYLLYQTLVGAWTATVIDDQEDWKIFSDRIENYMLKAIRESKQHTSWINRNAGYEEAVSAFVNKLLRRDSNNLFLKDFETFHRRVARIGLWNSLSQTLLKLTCPGVPDIYQGNELWDFSLVDPDNRRPVDYDLRRRLLESLTGVTRALDGSCVQQLLQQPHDGRLKLYLTWKALNARKELRDVFELGEYLPLEIHGAKANHALAFLRRWKDSSALVIVPRFLATLLEVDESPPVGNSVWQDTHIVLPSNAAATYRDAFTEKRLRAEENGTMRVAESLAEFPVALLVS